MFCYDKHRSAYRIYMISHDHRISYLQIQMMVVERANWEQRRLLKTTLFWLGQEWNLSISDSSWSVDTIDLGLDRTDIENMYQKFVLQEIVFGTSPSSSVYGVLCNFSISRIRLIRSSTIFQFGQWIPSWHYISVSGFDEKHWYSNVRFICQISLSSKINTNGPIYL